jgi:NitT/TauT family transport system substrate-binding protein
LRPQRARRGLCRLQGQGQKINVAYVFDTTRGIKLFADQAFFAVGNGDVAPFLLKKDAEAMRAKIAARCSASTTR